MAFRAVVFLLLALVAGSSAHGELPTVQGAMPARAWPPAVSQPPEVPWALLRAADVRNLLQATASASATAQALSSGESPSLLLQPLDPASSSVGASIDSILCSLGAAGNAEAFSSAVAQAGGGQAAASAVAEALAMGGGASSASAKAAATAIGGGGANAQAAATAWTQVRGG